MSKIKLIVAGALLSPLITAYADTCRETNQDLLFRQVVLGGGEVRCDYGPEFDFKHSYSLNGNYTAVSGPWMGASDPYTIYCRGGSASCVFSESN
jgi:hypothetical protein